MRAVSHTSRRAGGSSASTDGPTLTEELAIFRLDQLNDNNFFNLADFLWAISLDACGVFEVMVGDEYCGCYPVSFQDNLCGETTCAYQIQRFRVRCALNGFGFPRFQLRATNIELIAGH